MAVHHPSKLRPFAVSLLLLLLLSLPAIPAWAQAGVVEAPALAPAQPTTVYTNPILPQIPGYGVVESCADPTIVKGQVAGDPFWYAYCTMDPLNDADRDAAGDFNFRIIPMLRSPDLVNWEYMGDALPERPGWVGDNAGLWAPDIQFLNGRYYLYYAASDTDAGGSAIGVLTSDGPLGPWVDSGAPVVEPHAPPCCPGALRWVFDPSVIRDEAGQLWIFYGSYFGGISARRLSDDGLHSDPATQVQITAANKYEASFVMFRDGYYYLFVSATDCCRGPLTGYSVFAGRSESITGPYVDREGVWLNPEAKDPPEGRVGGTPVISMNGNRWVGPGHNVVFTDAFGQDWTLYHAIDQNDPYFEGATGFTKRPAMLDPLDWIDGWPTVRGGKWASDRPMPAPAAQPGQETRYRLVPAPEITAGQLLPEYSDEFGGDALGNQWTWVRPPDPATYGVGEGVFRFDTQGADLYVDSNNASVLAEAAPAGPYIVETKVRLTVPPAGCCFNYAQGGLVIYGDDDNFVKLVVFSNWETRQTEFAKEVSPVPEGYPRYGNTVVGPPGEWTWLRIVLAPAAARDGDPETGESYRAYTSTDGVNWVEGGVWTHNLGRNARIGLVSMANPDWESHFDYVRVYRPGVTR